MVVDLERPVRFAPLIPAVKAELPNCVLAVLMNFQPPRPQQRRRQPNTGQHSVARLSYRKAAVPPYGLNKAGRGRVISQEKEGMIHLAGMVVLMGLMLLIMFNDIRNLIFR